MNLCCICDRPVNHSTDLFVVDALGKDAHFTCYERLGTLPTPPAPLLDPVKPPEAAGVLDLPAFEDL